MVKLTHKAPSFPAGMDRVACDLSGFAFAVEPGATLADALAAGFADAGFVSGVAYLRGLTLSPLRYVLPSAREADEQGAGPGPADLAAVEKAVAIAGFADGAPFVHCHGIWNEEDGARHMGHVLAGETVIAAAGDVLALGTRDAAFIAPPDDGRGAGLLRRQTVRDDGQVEDALMLRVGPREDLTGAIERACLDARLPQAAVHGIGALDEIAFDDGRTVRGGSMEVMIRRGAVAAASGSATAVLEIAAVDAKGAIHEGVLARGSNPVARSFELCVEAVA